VVYSHYLAAICHLVNLAWQRRRRVAWESGWDVPAL